MAWRRWRSASICRHSAAVAGCTVCRRSSARGRRASCWQRLAQHTLFGHRTQRPAGDAPGEILRQPQPCGQQLVAREQRAPLHHVAHRRGVVVRDHLAAIDDAPAGIHQVQRQHAFLPADEEVVPVPPASVKARARTTQAPAMKPSSAGPGRPSRAACWPPSARTPDRPAAWGPPRRAPPPPPPRDTAAGRPRHARWSPAATPCRHRRTPRTVCRPTRHRGCGRRRHSCAARARASHPESGPRSGRPCRRWSRCRPRR